MTSPRVFHMKFEPMTIEHLGLRLYSTLPPVLTELVSNAYDAESRKVEVIFPTEAIDGDSEVIVRDFGHGMNADELEEAYLPIGRNRRGDKNEKAKSKHGLRSVTGRKGLGKLSAFGIAKEMEIRSVQSGVAWTLRLNYDRMKDWAKKHPSLPYEPTVVKARSGPTPDPDGVEVTLRKLHRTRKIDEEFVRRGLARRLPMIGPKFRVAVNDRAIAVADRNRPEDCSDGQMWDVVRAPAGGAVGETGFEARGWVGFVPKSSQTGRGVDIVANDKAAELGSFFNLASTHTQFARAYLVGEVHADFLDGSEDLIATARNSVIWEHPISQAFQQWGQELLVWAFAQWLEKRRREKEREITRDAGFDRWLASRQPSEQRAAKRMLSMLVDDESMDPESARPLLEIIKSSVETAAFIELVDSIEAAPAGAAALLRLFDEWRVIEAREHLQLADGRRSVIDKLEEFTEKGALEVTELQPLLAKNLWLLDRHWSEADVQPTYTKLLRRHAKEPSGLAEGDKRLDILGVTEGTRVMTVVELKRPEKRLTRKDLEQIEGYVDWARSNITGGTSRHSPASVEGLLIVGRIPPGQDLRLKIERLAAHNIRVETFRDLHNASRAQYTEIERRLERVAPEYTRSRRKAAQRNRP